MNELSGCTKIFRITLSNTYLSAGKVSSESEIGHVPNFEILVHLTWNDPVLKFELCNLLSLSKHNEKMKLMRLLFMLIRNFLLEMQSKILLNTKKKHFPAKKCIVFLD